MPRQNRVTPTGQIIADPARGAWMGNRGGKIHADGQLLPRRRWASRRWITCALHFKDRHRQVMGAGYTELFFLDEVTALAAGHRPCFECRRADAITFATAFAGTGIARADDMDVVLHRERIAERDTLHARSLPDGCFYLQENVAWLVMGGRAHEWTPSGYRQNKALPDHPVTALTPASIRAVLQAGYAPQVDRSGIGPRT